MIVRRGLWLAGVIVFWLGTAGIAAGMSSITLVDGKEYRGDLVSLSAQGALQLKQADGQTVDINSADIIEIFNQGAPPMVPGKGVKITFDNGDYLLGELLKGDDSSIALQSGLVGEQTFLFDHISELRVIENHSREDLFKDPIERGESDVIKLSGEDTLYTGTVTGVSREGVTFESELWPDGATLKFTRVQWISFARLGETAAPAEGLTAILKCNDGSRVSGTLQELAAGQLKLRTPYAPVFTLPLAAAASMSFKNGSFTYLSDLTPTDVQQDYMFEHSTLRFDFQRDTTVTGNPITLRGKTYRKGLGVHANNALTYEIGGEYRRLRAEIGIDDEVSDLHARILAGVVFIVSLDGKEIYRSAVLTLKSPVEKLDLDVTGGRRLTLSVQDGNGIISQDRADWAGAFLLK